MSELPRRESTPVAPAVVIAQAKLAIAKISAESAETERALIEKLVAQGAGPEANLRAARVKAAIAAEKVKIAEAKLRMAVDPGGGPASAGDRASVASAGEPAPELAEPKGSRHRGRKGKTG